MPMLVNMPINFFSTKFHTFLQELRKHWENWWWTNEVFDIFLECDNVFKYTFKCTYLMLVDLYSKVRIFINLNFIFYFKLITTSMVNLMLFYYFSYHLNGQPYASLLFFLPPQWSTLCIFIIFLITSMVNLMYFHYFSFKTSFKVNHII